MDPIFIKELVILCLFIIVLFCVFLPLKFAETAQRRGIDLYHSRRYTSIVSILNCFAAGIFLGTCLLHLFPDVRENIDSAFEYMNAPQKFPVAEFTIALGFFLLLTFEQVISDFREQNYIMPDPDAENGNQIESEPILGQGQTSTASSFTPPDVLLHQHNASIRVVALIMALSIHSVFEGIAIGVQNTVDSVLQITGALVIHKIVIAFSLGLTLSQSPLSSYKSFIGGLIFALATPIGVAIGLILWTKLESINGSLIIGFLQGMAAGTFLYVTFLEVLPHEFKSGHLHLPKLASFILGFSVICVAMILFPDS